MHSKPFWSGSLTDINCNIMSTKKSFSEHEPLKYSSTSPILRSQNHCQMGTDPQTQIVYSDFELKIDKNSFNNKDILIDPTSSQSKKKATPVSPCAQKIAAQREKNKNKRKGKRSLKRSSSLLCLDISSCRGVPKELLMADYEDVWSGEWEHSSLVDIRMDIPAPPSIEPPQPPTSTVNYSTRPPMPLPHEINNSKENSSNDNNHNPSSSSGNSTLEGSWSSGDDVYMVVQEQSKQGAKKTITKSALRKHVTRSLTWASSDKVFKKKENKNDELNSSRLSVVNTKTNPVPPPRPAKPSSNHSNQTPSGYSESPPLPPRKYKQNINMAKPALNEINIFNYSEFINRRLTLPEGNSRLDQRSYTSGNICGPWYDLWGEDHTVDIV